ncbi:MAG TPA: nitronate monooxygenase [Roseiflexaceae bacterium]|nr:nitronate monooxygenase [Roseiflexaceae bacterium]
MQFLQNIQLIQGGMGVYVSNWRLAQAVAAERPGVTAGTVSGTALDVVYVRLLQLGDPGGHARSALAAFDDRYGTGIGQKIVERYFIAGGKPPDARFKSAPMQILHAQSGVPAALGYAGEPSQVPLQLDSEIIELLIATGFAEVWLAKHGHSGNIFINFLNKIEVPLLYVLYGAMLAGVDGVIVGAGNPDGLAAGCSDLANHQPVTKNLSVLYQEAGEAFTLTFDPQQLANGAFTKAPLNRPAFLAIVALEGLVQALAESASEAPDGFIIEHHSAGGHNANPVGPLHLDALGQPIYSQHDNPDLAAIGKIGLPFWLAGGYGSHEKLLAARAAGATGVQTGSVFALAEESGMRPDYRSAILKELRNGADDAALVRTTMFSPTGFSFKVVQLRDTLSEQDVYESRRRVCDIGLLQQVGLSKPGEDGVRTLFQRCAAAPIEGYMHKRGLERNTEERRCLCNGLLACVGLGQVKQLHGEWNEEPAIVTLGNHLDGIRRLSRQGQSHYWAKDVVADILG